MYAHAQSSDADVARVVTIARRRRCSACCRQISGKKTLTGWFLLRIDVFSSEVGVYETTVTHFAMFRVRIAWAPIIVLLVLFFGGFFADPPQVYPVPVNKTLDSKAYCELGKL